MICTKENGGGGRVGVGQALRGRPTQPLTASRANVRGGRRVR